MLKDEVFEPCRSWVNLQVSLILEVKQKNIYKDPQIPESDKKGHIYEKLIKNTKKERQAQRFGEKSQKKLTFAISFAVWILIIMITGKKVNLQLYACL